MIDFIHGTVAELNPTYVVLEAGGLGYQINITLPTYSLSACLHAELTPPKAVRLNRFIRGFFVIEGINF